MSASTVIAASKNEHLSADRCQDMLRIAQSLEQGQGVLSLQGRNIALLCQNPVEADLRSLEGAATALGARVARLDAAAWSEENADSEALLRMLERLYDAVDCEGLPTERALSLQRRAGVPVFIGLACADHALHTLAPQLRALSAPGQTARSPADEERLLLQAWLISNLAA